MPEFTAPMDGLLAGLPPRVDRRRAAELISQHYFPIRPRSLERWPLAVRRVNRRALIETAELFAVAQKMLEQAPLIRAGRASKPQTAA